MNIRLQTVLEDYKVWRVVIFMTQWVSCPEHSIYAHTIKADRPLAQETSSLQWSELFLNGFIVTVCSAFLIRRCWKVNLL